MRFLLIILEGNECCFKSTIAKKLSKKLGFEIIKGSSFELAKSSQQELYEHFLNIAKMENKIIDRYIYSNLVYAPLFRDYSMISYGDKRNIESWLRCSEAVVVYLFASEEVIRQRLIERGDEYIKTDHIKEINEKYFDVMKNVSVPTIYMNTEVFDSETISNFIYTLVKTK